MAVEYGPQVLVTLTAGADLSASQYKFVKFSAGKVIECSGTTDIPIGVLQNNPSATGRAAVVLALGISKVQSDVNLAQGDIISTSADGQAAVAVSTAYPVGRVLFDTSGAAADLTTAYINCLNPIVKA